jgi:hypothetical protein
MSQQLCSEAISAKHKPKIYPLIHLGNVSRLAERLEWLRKDMMTFTSRVRIPLRNERTGPSELQSRIATCVARKRTLTPKIFKC